MDCTVAYSPTPTGRSSLLFTKISAIKYSFHLAIKLKIVTVITAGRASGNIISQKVFTGPQPSMAAASSSA